MSSRPQSRVFDDPNEATLTVGNPSQSSPMNDNDTNLDSSDARPTGALGRSASTASTKVYGDGAVSRGGTLKKKGSMRKRASLRRSGSKRSVRAGSMKMGDGEDNFHSVFHTPIPTSGNPTEILSNRFQAWRKLLKDLITYFREIQVSYEQRSKSLLKVSNTLNNTNAPSMFLSEGGLDDATRILRGFHKHSVTEANKAKDIENDVIVQLNGLRNDLGQKIKEIKSLSGDFKNTVDKEKDGTRKAVAALQDALHTAELDPSSAAGKNDPFIVKLSVDRQVEKQIEEENYLHRAYLNLEGSGRELESIVVGEIQKAYNAYAGILKREADSAQGTSEELRSGPISIPKDREWEDFVEHEQHFVSPNVRLRQLEDIHYPGKFDPAAQEIRAGMLERKSKYLKSYTPGWYVLSPTHLHEFKSADHIYTQQPVMSLSLLDQKLGSHSQNDASSHKFSLKGRQSGGMHRGHSWVFRAESHDTMMAWFSDIKSLTEKTGEEKTAFVRRHARSVSASSTAAMSTASSDGMEEDDADRVPYSASHQPSKDQDVDAAGLAAPPKRPDPGGRFPSDIKTERAEGLQVVPSQSSGSEPDFQDNVGESALAGTTAGAAVISGHDDHNQPRQGYFREELDDSIVGTEAKAAGALPAHHQQHAAASPPSDEPESSGGVGQDLATPEVHPLRQHPEPNSTALQDDSAAAGAAVFGSSSRWKDVEASEPQRAYLDPRTSRQDTIAEIHVPGEWRRESQA